MSVASGGGDATICLWDPHNGTNLETLRHPGPVWAVAFSPDGRLLASGCFGGEMCLWERQQSEPSTWVQTLSTQTNWITDLAFSPEGRTLATAHRDPMVVRLWEVENLRLLHTLSELQAKHLAWSPDRRTLACSGGDKTIWLWDVEQCRSQAALHGHTADVYSLPFAPNGSRLLSSSADGTLRVWDVESHQCVRVIQGYGLTLDDLDWSPDGTHLVSGGDDTLVTIWDVDRETVSSMLHGHSWYVTDVRWSPDGRLVASCGWDRTIRLWDATSGTCVQIFEGQALLICVAWSPDGSLLACGTHQRGMQMWDVNARSLRWVGQPYQIDFSDVAWSPDGTRLASSSDDGSVYLWKSEDGTLLQRLSGHHGWVLRVAWSPDGTRLVSSSSSGELFVWDVQSIEANNPRRDSGLSLSTSPVQENNPRRDSGLPLSTSPVQSEGGDKDRRDSGLSLSASPSPVQTFVGHPSEVFAVAWSPDGHQLISGCGDGMLRWWDVATAECVDMRETHHGTVRSLKVSPDGQFLASCGYDEGAIRIWGLSSHELLRTLRHDRPYERLNITGIRGLTEAQKSSLRALGATDAAVVP